METVKLSVIWSVLRSLTKAIDPGRGSHAFMIDKQNESRLNLLIIRNEKFHSFWFDMLDDMTEKEIVDYVINEMKKKE